MVPDNLTVLNYPITTPEAEKFWASKHKANKAQSIIAFSLTLENANDNLRRYGYTYQNRKKALAAFKECVNQPEMTSDKFTYYEASVPYWEAMPFTPTP